MRILMNKTVSRDPPPYTTDIIIKLIGSGCHLMVKIHDLRAVSCGFESQKKSMVVAGRTYDLNSLLSSSKVSLLTSKQPP